MELALSVAEPQVVTKRLSFFERYLTLWVALCMVAGVVIGQALPGLVSSLRAAEIGQGSHINLPIAVLIWLMIVPMMMKVEFAARCAALLGGDLYRHSVGHPAPDSGSGWCGDMGWSGWRSNFCLDSPR